MVNFGAYYIIGGVGSPDQFNATFNGVTRLYSKSETPKLLFVDAANDNQHEYTSGFEENFKTQYPDGQFVKLDIDDQHTVGETQLRDIFKDTNILYMNGGDPDRLMGAINWPVFEDCMESLYINSGLVGGMSAGGIVLAREFALKNNDGSYGSRHGTNHLPQYIVSAHMERSKEEVDARIGVLQKKLGTENPPTALALSANAAFVFQSDPLATEHRVTAIRGKQDKPATAFSVDQAGKRHKIEFKP